MRNGYVISEDKKYIEMSIHYESTGNQAQFTAKSSDLGGSSFIFNGRKSETDPIVQDITTTDTEGKFWNIPGAKFSFNTDKVSSVSTSVCVHNSDNFFLAMEDSENFIDQVLSVGCSGYKAGSKSCIKDEFNIDKCPQIEAKFSNSDTSTTIKFDPVDYIYYQDITTTDD